jgi:alanine racemase
MRVRHKLLKPAKPIEPNMRMAAMNLALSTRTNTLDARPTWKEFDLDALVSNYEEMRRRVGSDTAIIGSVKANAYGHGVVPVAQTLVKSGIYALATSSFDDALALRRAGIATKIQMLAGTLPSSIADLLHYQLIPTVHNMELARAISYAARGPTAVYLKIDSGFGQPGIRINDATAFVNQLMRLPNIVVEGIYTHLSFFDRRGLELARAQSSEFDALLGHLEANGIRVPISQSLASAGVAVNLATRCNTVCVGRNLYGLPAVEPNLDPNFIFKPVLTAIRSCIIHITSQSAGTHIGTGGSRQLRRDSRLGVIPIGRCDGYGQAKRGRFASVLVRGRRAPALVVNLEHTVVDLTDVTEASLGDEVTLLGRNGGDYISLAEMARARGVCELDVLMSCDRRMPAHYHRTSHSDSQRVFSLDCIAPET